MVEEFFARSAPPGPVGVSGLGEHHGGLQFFSPMIGSARKRLSPEIFKLRVIAWAAVVY